MTVATALVYGGWTPAHLLAMLDDEAYLPPTLALKCDRRPDPATGKDVDVPSTQKVEVRRVQQTGQTGAFIEKRYLGRYANRAKYEANMLDLVQNLPRIKGHVVGSVGKFQSTTSELLLVTPWVGLSVEDWNALLGDSSPFKSSCVAVLALARAVLRATQEFHQVGFVHCDLQPQNIVIGHTSTPRKGWYRLNLAETRLIDLEFSLPPLTAVTESGGRQVTIPREWFRDKNNALLCRFTPNWRFF